MKLRSLKTVLLTCALAMAACAHVKKDPSIPAVVAGQSTLALGSCQGGFNIGWSNCYLEKGGESFPALEFAMTNAGSYAVSDCELGIYQTGAVEEAALVKIDLKALAPQIAKNGFCLIKVEAIEHFQDEGNRHDLVLRGGFFIEALDHGYFPIPDHDTIEFCQKIERTVQGRTVISPCGP